MHRETSNRLAEEPSESIPRTNSEDVIFTARLLKLGYSFKSTPKLRANRNPDDHPKPGNDIFTCHWVRLPGLMQRLHAGYIGQAGSAGPG
jgi:hypothetical protein